jgi:hypothetical protein
MIAHLGGVPLEETLSSVTGAVSRYCWHAPKSCCAGDADESPILRLVTL